MNSPALKTPTTMTNNSLATQLKLIGLRALPTQLDDFIARVTKARCSAHQILEEIAKAEATERSRRSLERRLRISGIKRFKPMADFDWSWPAKIERDIIERALTLDFLGETRNLILVGRNGLGKTMIAQNIAHAAVLAGHTVLFRSAAALLEELHRQSPEGRRRKLRGYANVGLLCIDEVGYLSFDDKAADLLYEVVNRRYERKPVILTTNLLCGAPHNRFNAEPIFMRSRQPCLGAKSCRIKRCIPSADIGTPHNHDVLKGGRHVRRVFRVAFPHP